VLDLKRVPPRNHIYDPLTKTMRHHQGTLYRTRRPWRRYAKTVLAVAVIVAVGTWALTEAVTWAVDTFLLPKGLQ
jgi:hypothetical protein